MNRQCTCKATPRFMHTIISTNKSMYLVIMEVLEMQSSKQTELPMWLLQRAYDFPFKLVYY